MRILCVLLVACVTPPPQASSLPEHDSMAQLAKDYWEESLRYEPMAATSRGVRTYDLVLDDLSPAAAEQHGKTLRLFLQRAQLLKGELNRDLLVEQIQRTLLVDDACHYAEWKIDHLAGLQAQLAELAQAHSVETPERASALVTRYYLVPRLIEQHIDNLRRGLNKGWVAAELNVRRTIVQLDGMKASTFVLGKDPELQVAVDKAVLPALRRYRDFLHTAILPEARKAPGVSNLSIGPACYLAEIRAHTGLSMSPQEIHRLGIDEVARIRREMDVVMKRIAKTQKAPSVREVGKLLDADKTQHYASRGALLDAARGIVGRAQKALPRAFSRLPRTPLVVEPLEAYREKESPAAYYFPAPMDHSKPGRYLLNTFQPESRVAYDNEALAFHEGVPGHHLQVALAQELSDLPEFRRFGGQSAYVEGWALYAEKLADELGLYSGDAAQFGRLSSECWRALRLMVDTGLHVYGWSREQAIETMLDSAASPRIEVENEVDRYVTWPGQALAYKIGELEIWRLRRLAEKRRGKAFNLQEFHAQILEQGPMPLGILGKRIERSF